MTSPEYGYRSRDEELDYLVDTLNISYDDADRRLGNMRQYDIPKYEPQDVATEQVTARDDLSEDGPSISLVDRAAALDHIFSAYNQANKARGARESGYTTFRSQYGREAGEVARNMNEKATTKAEFAKGAFAALAMTDELISAGFDATDVRRDAKDIKNTLDYTFGPGKAYAPDREKALRTVRVAAGLPPRKPRS